MSHVLCELVAFADRRCVRLLCVVLCCGVVLKVVVVLLSRCLLCVVCFFRGYWFVGLLIGLFVGLIVCLRVCLRVCFLLGVGVCVGRCYRRETDQCQNSSNPNWGLHMCEDAESSAQNTGKPSKIVCNLDHIIHDVCSEFGNTLTVGQFSSECCNLEHVHE